MIHGSGAMAIDIVLEPDETMLRYAGRVNERLRADVTDGFRLDEAHRPHITALQRFVATTDIDRVTEAAQAVIEEESPTAWDLTARGHYYIPNPPVGLAGVVIEPTEGLLCLQRRLIEAVAPYAVADAGADAFISDVGGADIQDALIDYVRTFVPAASGEHFNPHVSTGVGTIEFLDAVSEDFEPFRFSPTGAGAYQLGTYGTAQRRIATLI